MSDYSLLKKKYAQLRPEVTKGAFCLGIASAVSILGLFLSLQHNFVLWMSGQLILAVAILQWFFILHEAGHNTVFPSSILNRTFGELAGAICFIPFSSWKAVHWKHHVWTGWQDKDPTTHSLVEKELPEWKKKSIDFAWKWHLPLFSIVYRVSNFWNFPRLWKMFATKTKRKKIFVSVCFIFIFWSVILLAIGAPSFLRVFGLAFILHLVISDPLMLSQHSHIEQHTAGSQQVSPHPYFTQAIFTRSLVFSPLVSRYLFFGFDRHENHHQFPNVPGYHLHQVSVENENAINWLEWLSEAKKIPGHQLLFSTREETGVWL